MGNENVVAKTGQSTNAYLLIGSVIIAFGLGIFGVKKILKGKSQDFIRTI